MHFFLGALRVNNINILSALSSAVSTDIFQNLFFFIKFFQEHYQSVKRFGSRSGLMFPPSCAVSKLCAKAISGQQNSPQAREEFTK